MSDAEDQELETQPVVEEEPEIEEDREKITSDVIAAGLSQIKKTASKIAHSHLIKLDGQTYAFTCLNLEKK